MNYHYQLWFQDKNEELLLRCLGSDHTIHERVGSSQAVDTRTTVATFDTNSLIHHCHFGGWEYACMDLLLRMDVPSPGLLRRSGKVEQTERFLGIALYQGKSMKKKAPDSG